MLITLNLTDAQEREFSACAKAAHISIEKWIEECASVKAASVIDAIQASNRATRNSSLLSNATINARRAKRTRTSKTSKIIEAAREYNAKFK